MIKLSRTGITILKRQYKSVLLKCLLINAGILFAAGNAMAEAASDVSYVNTSSGLGATNVQAAIDELASEKQDTMSAGDTTISVSENKIYARYDGTTITTSDAGLKVVDGGIGTTQLANSAVTLDKINSSAIKGATDTTTYTGTQLTTQGYVDEALAGKVDKVEGKGLSTNDYTNADKEKLGGIAAGAQVNVIETIKVNGTALTPDANKAVDIRVPAAKAGNGINVTTDEAGDAVIAVVADTTSGTIAVTSNGVKVADNSIGATQLDLVVANNLLSNATAGNGLTITAGNATNPANIALNLQANKGLEATTEGLAVKLDGTSLVAGDNGLKVNDNLSLTTLSTTGTATIGGKLTVSDGGASIKGYTAVDGELSATGNISSSTGDIIADKGDIIATTGDITANNGSVSAKAVTTTTTVSAGTTVTAGTGVIATTGNITASAGNLVATAGNLVATAGNVEANAGSVSGKTLKNANSTFKVEENGDLAVSKSTTEYVKLNADGTMSTSGAATIGGDLTAAGAATLNSTLNVADTATFGDTTGEQVVLADGVVTADQGLVVNAGGANITGDSTIDGALSVTGQTKASSFANTNNTFTVDTAGQVKGRNFSNNNSTFVVTTSGALTASEYHNKNNTFVVNTKGDLTANSVTTTADATIGGALTVAGAATLNSTLNVADTATFGDTTGEQVVLDGGVVTADQGLVVNAGGANITGNSTIDGTLHVTDAVTLDKTLDVAGLASLDGGINVNDKLTVAANGDLTTSGVSKLNGGIAVQKDGTNKFLVTQSGNVTAAGSLIAAGNKFVVTSGGNVTATTYKNADSSFAVTTDGTVKANDVLASGNLAVAGDSTLKGTLEVRGATTLKDTLDVAGATTLNDTLTVAGAATLKDTLDVAGLTTLSADNGMRFGTGQVVKSIEASDDGVAAKDKTALATVQTVLTSAENADYTGTTLNATGARPATVKDGLNLIGNVNSFAGGRHIAGAETLADATVALDKGLTRLEDKVRDFKKEFKSGMAQMAAMSALVPNARAHGDTQISVGTGAYEGQTAAAFGGFHWINDNLMLNIGASYGDSNNMAYRAGLTWSW